MLLITDQFPLKTTIIEEGLAFFFLLKNSIIFLKAGKPETVPKNFFKKTWNNRCMFGGLFWVIKGSVNNY